MFALGFIKATILGFSLGLIASLTAKRSVKKIIMLLIAKLIRRKIKHLENIIFLLNISKCN